MNEEEFNEKQQEDHDESYASHRVRYLQAKLRYPSGLDFERVVNQYSIQATRERLRRQPPQHPVVFDDKRPLLVSSNEEEFYQTFPSSHAPVPPARRYFGQKRTTVTRWILIILTGILTGVVSVIVVFCTDAIQQWGLGRLDALWQTNANPLTVFVLYAALNLGFALLSAALCLFVAPQAVGSGIPEVKAYLNGVRVKRFNSARLLFVKITGTILSVSSGLSIGKEGPSVHMGAILGASCTKISNLLLRIFPNRWCSGQAILEFVATDLSHFSVDAERRDFVSIGAAAGFAASFGAPIGGLLFALEATSSFTETRMFLRTLVATTIATFCMALYHGDLSLQSIIDLGTYETPNSNIFLNRVEEIPLYILVGIVGGILGGIFCRCWEALQLFRQRQNMKNTWKLAEVALVSLVTSTLMYFIPIFVSPPGEVNKLAEIMQGSRLKAITEILTEPGHFRPVTLLVVGLVFFPLMIWTLGVSLPSGIYTPTFLVGSSLGGFAGLIFQETVSEELSASTFALLGAAALLVAIQRSTVSHCVILVEGTGQNKVLLPVIFTAVIARFVAAAIHPQGLYDTGMELKNFPYLDHNEKKLYDVVQAREVMSAPPETIGPRERVSTLVRLLCDSSHNGFPVVDPDTKKFLGLVRRDQMVALLECGVFDEQQDDSSSVDSSDWSSSKRGSTQSNSPLMQHLALHIKDDRYEHLDSHSEKTRKGRISEDSFDQNAWLISVLDRRKSNRVLLTEGDDAGLTVSIGEDSLPPLRTAVSTETTASSSREELTNFAVVGTNEKGQIYVERMARPEYNRRWVHVAGVMNQGTYAVSEFCPVSKVHYLFTALGLRHLVVLGGEGGGKVVGVVTRINLLKEYIEERTGYEF